MRRFDLGRMTACGVVAGLLVICALAGPVRAEEPSFSLLEQAEDRMLLIQNHLTNASVRINSIASGNSGSMGGSSRAGNHPCCGWNIDNMREGAEGLRAALGELRACFVEADRDDALAAVDIAADDVDDFTDVLALFEAASTLSDANEVLSALTGPWVRLRADVSEIEECAPPETGKKRTEKKNRGGVGSGE